MLSVVGGLKAARNNHECERFLRSMERDGRRCHMCKVLAVLMVRCSYDESTRTKHIIVVDALSPSVADASAFKFYSWIQLYNLPAVAHVRPQ